MDQHADERTSERKPARQIALRWGSVKGLPTTYANHILISHATGTEFYLIFGELVPLTILRPEEVEDRELPPYLEIEPVAKIAVSAEAMRRMVEAMQKNLDRYEEALRHREDVEAEDNG